ncbi:MAG: sigma-70 family RNA polymerase sigma factor [Deltaproteobacteria bacterium]|nr:sigma-70 family RNA polymerase sigma factor [Deltaproteobacteria bacterium]
MIKDNTIADTSLVERIKQGDTRAMEMIVERYSNKVYNLAYHLTRDSTAAEEIMQDVFLTVLSKIHTLNNNAYFSTWLYRVTTNAAYAHMRYLRKDKKNLEDLRIKDLEKDTSQIYDWSRLPEDILLSDESKQILKDAIDSLPEPMRIVVVMKDVEGLKNEEIAKTLGLSLPAVKSRLHRGRLLLRESLSNYFKKYATPRPGGG